MAQLPTLVVIDMKLGLQFEGLLARNNPAAENTMAFLHVIWRRAGLLVISISHLNRSADSVFALEELGAVF